MIRIDIEDPMIAGRRHTDWVVGIIEEQRSMYSGGGASAQRLSLYLLPTGSSGVLGQDILTVPIKAYAMIRACFTENDFERRRGACHDEYTFDGTITVAPRQQARGQQNGMPDLRFSTVATAYPHTSTMLRMTARRCGRAICASGETPCAAIPAPCATTSRPYVMRWIG
jgi:hypothetical protein